jgi:uncharacterized membrane protein
MGDQPQQWQRATGGAEGQSANAVSGSGYIFAVCSAVATAMATVVGKWNLAAISPLLLNSLIFTVATALLSVSLVPAWGVGRVFRHNRRGWLWILAFTFTSLVALWAYWTGVQLMDPSLATFLNRTEVPIAIMLGIIFLKERFTTTETIGAILSIAGIVIMRITLRVEYSDGFWFVLGGSVFFGLTEFVSKIAVRHVHPMILTYLRNGFMAVMFWIVFLSIGGSYDGLDRVWPGVIALGFLGPLLARGLYLTALKRMELSKVAVISQSQPIFVMILAYSFLSQLPTFREMIGGLFIIAGVILMALSRYRPGMNRAGQLAQPEPGK